jgi:dihydrolipoamide dehydrogenase
MDSDAALDLDRVPGSIAIIGGGVIGVEFAQIFRNLGAEVTVIEMLPRLLAAEDEDVSAVLRLALESSGITVRTGALVERIDRSEGSLRVVLKGVPAIPFVDADKVLVAIGRKPALDVLDPGRAGIPLEKGAIRVDERMATGVPGIYAVGDAAGGLMLAHKATMEGECAAENAAGLRRFASYTAIPRVVYTDPEIACVGLTEEESRRRYGKVLVGRFPFSMSGRAILERATLGFAKVVAEPEFGCVVGVTVVGRQAAQAIGEGALAVRMEATVADLCDLVHAHPTFSEALREAALDAEGRVVHIPPGLTAGPATAIGRLERAARMQTT